MRGAIAKKSTVEGEWRPVFKDRDGAWTILLNKDPESRARTLAVKYTKGFEVLESLHDGTVEVLVLEGQWQVGPIVYGPGDYFWSSVEGMHALANRSDEPVRWLETQAPQPPSRHQFRYRGDWERLVSTG